MSKRKSKKSKNTTLIVFLVITIVLVIALLLYFLLQKRDNFSVKENYQSSKGGNSGDSGDTENTGTQTSKGGQKSCPANIFNDAIDNASKRYDDDVPNGVNSSMICDEGFYKNKYGGVGDVGFFVKCNDGKVDNYNNVSCIKCNTDTNDFYLAHYEKYCARLLKERLTLSKSKLDSIQKCREKCEDDKDCGAFAYGNKNGDDTCWIYKKEDYDYINDGIYDAKYDLYIRPAYTLRISDVEKSSCGPDPKSGVLRFCNRSDFCKAGFTNHDDCLPGKVCCNPTKKEKEEAALPDIGSDCENSGRKGKVKLDEDCNDKLYYLYEWDPSVEQMQKSKKVCCKED